MSYTLPKTYTQVTYAEAVTLRDASGISTGTIYKITDKGDRGIFLKGLSPDKFSIDGQRLMLVPADYTVGGFTRWITTTLWKTSKNKLYNNLI